MKNIIVYLTFALLVSCGGSSDNKTGGTTDIEISGDFPTEVMNNPDFQSQFETILYENRCSLGADHQFMQYDLPNRNGIRNGEIFIGVTPAGDVAALYKTNQGERLNLYTCQTSILGKPSLDTQFMYIEDSNLCPTGFLSDLGLMFSGNYTRYFEPYHSQNGDLISILCQ